MADSAALRMRRTRAHRRGDHSLCLPANCAALGGGGRQYVPPPPMPEPSQGRVAAAVAAHLAHFGFPEGDPRGVLTLIALRLAEQLDRDGKPGVAHELRGVLDSLGVLPDEESDALDDLQMRFHVRRAARLLGAIRDDPTSA